MLTITGLFLTACSFSEMAAKTLPDEVQTQMEKIIDAVIRHDFDTIKANGSDEFNAIDNLEENFTEIFQYILTDETNETKLINANVKYHTSPGSSSVTHYTAQYEVNYAKGSNLYTLILAKKADDKCCTLQTVNVQKFDSPPSTLTQFTFKGKGIKHFLVLISAILIPIFIITNLVKCTRTKGLKRKWLWMLFILVGVYGLTFNWHTGQLGMSLISKTETGIHISLIDIQILGVGVTKSGLLAPWIFKIGFPLGALMFWFKSRKLTQTIG